MKKEMLPGHNPAPSWPTSKSILAAPSTQPCSWARARAWPGAGCLPPRLSLPLAGPLPLPSDSPPCPLPPSSGSLILSSWKPDSLFPLLSLLPPSLSLPAVAPPPPLGGLWPQGCLAASLLRLQTRSAPRRPPAAVRSNSPATVRSSARAWVPA